MGRDRRNKGRDTGRIAGGFIALPWSVVDSPAYMELSYPAKALLIEIDRQYVRDNNGRMLASRAYLKKRGWKSQDVITRALRELINAQFIHKTVQGHRPNKASWFAVTWRRLDRIAGYDFGASENFNFGGSGGGGAFLRHFGEEWFEPAVSGVKPLDTTGAGDAFAAGFLSSLLKGERDPKNALRAGHMAAADVISRVGTV